MGNNRLKPYRDLECANSGIFKTGSGRCILWILAIAALTGLAFWIRIRNWNMVFTAEGVRFLGNDSLYHMRRVGLAVVNGLRIPGYDPFLNYPAGLHPNWPPVFDQLMAAAALVAGGGDPQPHLVQTVGALTPAVIGALVIPVVFFIARRFMHPLAAFAGATAAVFLPYSVQLSVLGRPDHHVAAVLFSSLLLLFAVRALEAPHCRTAIREGAMAGCCLFLCLGVWIGALLLVFVITVTWSAVLLLNAGNRDRSRSVLAGGCTLFLTAGVLFAPIVFNSYFYEVGIAAWDAPSAFHLFILWGVPAGLVALHELVRSVSVSSRMSRALHVCSAVALLGMLAVTAWRLGVFDQISGGAEWIARSDSLMSRLVESFPLTWRSAAENFTWLFAVWPLLLVWIAIELVQRRRTQTAVLLVVWSATLIILALQQERFSDMLSVIAAILTGKACESAVRLSRRIAQRVEAADAPICPRLVLGCCGALCILIFGLAARPSVRWLRGYWHSAPRYSQEIIYDWCLWLRSNTPDPCAAPYGRCPGYSVLASWPYGHAITYIGKRPNVANPYVGWAENREASLAPYRFFVEDDVAKAKQILDKYGVRYVVVMESLSSGHFADMLAALGLPHDTFFVTHQTEGGPVYAPTQRLFKSMIHRLYLENGDGMDDFRLVYESPAKQRVGSRELPQFKIFEYLRDEASPPGIKTAGSFLDARNAEGDIRDKINNIGDTVF